MNTDSTLSGTAAQFRQGGSRLLRSLLRSWPALLGLMVLTSFVLLALFGSAVAPHDPATPHLAQRLSPPVWLPGGHPEFLLGTDQLGRDILSRLIHGSRVALTVGFVAVGLATIIGVTLGLLSGYFGGWIDSAIMRVVDTLISIPNILLYLTVLGVFGPSLSTLVLVIGLINWTTFARVVRGEVLALRSREFVEAARASGQWTALILLRHVLPSLAAPIIVVATLSVAATIVLEAALSFLGLGVQPPTVTWGRMLADGRAYISTAWWLATFPGVFISLLCLALILFGDWLRDFFDPRKRT